jgi:RNA polymerase-binding transcription factor DksA
MNKELLEENKKKLLAEQARIEILLGHVAKKDATHEFPGGYKPEHHEIGDTDDENASESTQFETDLAVTKNLEEKLAKVKAALQRIGAGNYGKDKSGNNISEERLRAVPEADE